MEDKSLSLSPPLCELAFTRVHQAFLLFSLGNVSLEANKGLKEVWDSRLLNCGACLWVRNKNILIIVQRLEFRVPFFCHLSSTCHGPSP